MDSRRQDAHLSSAKDNLFCLHNPMGFGLWDFFFVKGALQNVETSNGKFHFGAVAP